MRWLTSPPAFTESAQPHVKHTMVTTQKTNGFCTWKYPQKEKEKPSTNRQFLSSTLIFGGVAKKIQSMIVGVYLHSYIMQ